MKQIKIKNFTIGNNLPFILIGGPCQIESESHALEMAHAISEICEELSISYIYKSSFDKANRSSINSERGIGIDKSLKIFDAIAQKFNIPILTDIHTEQQVEILKDVIDIFQIPAFLCRQTDLLLAAARTGKIVNVKKGQFLSPYDMKNIVHKIESQNNFQILLTERGTSFGYGDLVVDMRSLEIMAQETSYPIIFDVTHSVQKPGGFGNSSGGNHEFIYPLAKAATAIGIAGLFMEIHEDPMNAPSDGACMLKLSKLKNRLEILKNIDKLCKAS